MPTRLGMCLDDRSKNTDSCSRKEMVYMPSLWEKVTGLSKRSLLSRHIYSMQGVQKDS